MQAAVIGITKNFCSEYFKAHEKIYLISTVLYKQEVRATYKLCSMYFSKKKKNYVACKEQYMKKN